MEWLSEKDNTSWLIQIVKIMIDYDIYVLFPVRWCKRMARPTRQEIKHLKIFSLMHYQQQKSLLFLLQFPRFKSGFGRGLWNLHWLLPLLSSLSMHWDLNAKMAGTETAKTTIQEITNLLKLQFYFITPS